MSMNTPEPAPIPNAGLPVWPMVIAEIEAELDESYVPFALSEASASKKAWERNRRISRLIHDDMVERHAIGAAKYGTALCVGDGRDSATDLYQELLDAVVYCRKETEEARAGSRASRVVGVEVELLAMLHRLKSKMVGLE